MKNTLSPKEFSLVERQTYTPREIPFVDVMWPGTVLNESLTSFPHAVCNLNHTMVKFGNSELSSDKDGTGKDASHRLGGRAAGWYRPGQGFQRWTHIWQVTHI